MKKIYAILSLALLYVNANAQLAGYSYIKPITVTNTATLNAINYQLRLTINTQSLITASQMLATGDDIRFGKNCSGTTLYNYWIESGINTPTTTIWVKIDTILAGGSRTFFMYYGNTGATAVSSIPLVFNGIKSATDSVASGGAGGVGNSQRGFRFSPNEDILVTSFGKREPTGTTRYVTLFDNTSTSIISQIQVSGPAATYSYAPLANPIWLTQGTQYVLQLFQGASDGYYFGTSSQINSRLTYYDMRYCNSCTQNTFPTNVLTNYHYGYPDLQFYWKNNITPAPTYSIGTAALPSVSVASSSSVVCAGQAATLTASGANSYVWTPSGSGTSIVVTPTTAASYTVVGTNTITGCSNSNTIALGVNALPSVSATASSTVICAGQSATLTASGANNYNWTPSGSGSSIAVSPSVTTSYTVTGTNTVTGCSNNSIVSLNVNTLPAVNASTSNTLICAGQSATLTATGANNYSWTPSGSGSSIVVSPTITASYTVTGTNTVTGCSNTSIVTQNVNACLGINALTLTETNSIYPNPNNGKFSIDLVNESQVEVTNLLGEIVYSQKMKKGISVISLSESAKGIYLVKITANNKQNITKIIVQ